MCIWTVLDGVNGLSEPNANWKKGDSGAFKRKDNTLSIMGFSSLVPEAGARLMQYLLLPYLKSSIASPRALRAQPRGGSVVHRVITSGASGATWTEDVVSKALSIHSSLSTPVIQCLLRYKLSPCAGKV